MSCTVRHRFYVLAMFVLCVTILCGVPHQIQWSDNIAAANEPTQKKRVKPPPLMLDTDSPLLLDGGDTSAKPAKKMSKSVAENTACYVCHENYRQEPFVRWHGEGDVGCIDCHGKSYAHRNDENNTTPPDVMIPLEKIDKSCKMCHDSHDVPAREVLIRLTERKLTPSAAKPIVCTDCHGQHRLKHRTVVWDRRTRKLLTGSKESAPRKTP